MNNSNSKYNRSTVSFSGMFDGVFGGVALKGRVISAPESMFSTGGKAMFKFSLAVDQGKKAEGEQYRPSVIFNVTVWGSAAEWAGKSVTKGQFVIVDVSKLSASTEIGKGDRIFWNIDANNIQHAMPFYAGDAQPGEADVAGEPPIGSTDMPF